jgi:hypothetical protein
MQKAFAEPKHREHNPKEKLNSPLVHGVLSSQNDASKHRDIPVNPSRASDVLKNQMREELWDDDTTMGVSEFEASPFLDHGQNHKKSLLNQLQLPEGPPESIEETFTGNKLDSQPRVPAESS